MRARVISLVGPAALALQALLAGSSCFSPESIECPLGNVCPPGTRCAPDLPVCIKDECGDGYLDPALGEVCDDGNVVSGDGCRADCRSTESCGNAIVDNDFAEPARNEACDDGNTVGGDGCSADCKSDETCGNALLDDDFEDASRNEVCDDGNTADGDGCSRSCKSDESCGNGTVDDDFDEAARDEVCDDGNNASGDGCSADCKSDESCGNDVVDVAAGEVCDGGNTEDGDGCSADCTSNELCGNHITDTAIGEICDDGNNVSGDGCSADCLSLETCGNGYVDDEFDAEPERNEACDDGNTEDGDGCSADCKSNEACGNGVLDVSFPDPADDEVCDDGNTSDGDGCNAECASNETCGNGFVDVRRGEQCDQGELLSGAPFLDNDGCSANCLSTEVCGNGVVDAVKSEICDDGNTSSADGCRSDCKSDETCGNGLVDVAAGEVCDWAINPDCSADCTRGFGCGNGFIEPGESCDPGEMIETAACDYDCTTRVCGDGYANLTAGSGETCDRGGNAADCDADCSAPICGDGFVNPATAPPEQCDPGLAGWTATCDIDCTSAFCGDGTINAATVPPELCDDGNVANGDDCLATCVPNACGDGYVDAQPPTTEACDDAGESAECNDDCTIAICGDALVNGTAGEACDDAGETAACDADCTGRRCGDGWINLALPEACDDGNELAGDGCAADCAGLEPGYVCSTPAGPHGPTVCTTACGDGVEVPGEACDDNNTETCGTCSADCLTDQPVAKATGTVTFVDADKFNDGDTITINDGVNSPATVFEFDSTNDGNGNGVGSGNVRVVLDRNDDVAAEVATKFAAKVNEVGVSLLVSADTPAAAVVTLRNDRDGAAGNVAIQYTYRDAGYRASGMSGGAGYDCDNLVECARAEDCRSRICSGGVCQPAGTTCATGVQDGNETDVDCGGSCPGCAIGDACLVNGDCAAGMCSAATHLCLAPLTVTKDGAGTGTVVSGEGTPLIDCGATCAAGYAADAVVTLTATASADSTFGGWTGCDTPAGNTCTVTMNAARTVTATFTRTAYGLTVTPGAGGTVSSSPAGIACPGDCAEAYDLNTVVTLVATPNVGFSVGSWTGCDSASGSACLVTMASAKTVSVAFSTITYTLAVNRTGTGAGTVASGEAPTPFISCGSDCSEAYAHGSTAVLTATAAAGSTFTGWAGCPSPAGNVCTATMTQARTITASFNATTYLLTVTKDAAGTGTGSVTSVPAGIECDGACASDTGTYGDGTVVALIAAPDTGSAFAGWTGACSGSETTCTVTMSAARSVTARFDDAYATLTVVKAGTGNGTVTGSGISCGNDCTESYLYGTDVTLSASAQPGSTFVSWSGGGCSGTGTCVVDMIAATTVTATFSKDAYTLTITKSGGGTGTVTALLPSGTIDCGSTCDYPYDAGTLVGLVATPAAGSTFAAWTGACTGATDTCVVTMDAAKSVNAEFNLQSHVLTVSKTGSGAGSLASSPAGIDCGATCAASFTHGQSVTLTPTASSDSVFVEWTGACTGTGACSVSMTQARFVTARFDLGTRALSVQKDATGTGTGTLSSAPAGILCDGACSSASASFEFGTIVTLIAAPSAGSVFAGWTGACVGSEDTCVVTMDAAKTVTAKFNLQTHVLTVAKTGSGTGSLVSIPAGIDCGSTCSASFTHGQSVTLTPTASSDSVFVEWTGACTGTGACSVSMTQARFVTARFDLGTRTLSVEKDATGTGTGTVSSAPAGIVCDGACASASAPFEFGTVVTLVAEPDVGSVFAGWTGVAGCGSEDVCVVTMDAAATVTATFDLASYAVTVYLLGAGGGSVASAPAGISCGADCSEVYEHGTTVTLTASPDASSEFGAWTGCDSVAVNVCTVDVAGARDVTASFAPKTFLVTVTLSGTQAGTVTSAPGGISCGADCEEPYEIGSVVVLTATADASSTFTGWSGGGCSGTGLCVLGVDAAKTVDASFSTP